MRTTGEGNEELAERLRQRDPRALETLYDHLARQAFGLAYRILGDGHAAEDIVQEAFLTVWRQADRLDSARGSVTSYLMTVVHHKAVDLVRARQGREARHLPLDPAMVEAQGLDIEEALAVSLGRKAIRGALETLPQEQRRTIELAYFEGLTHNEIAEVIGIPLGTVKSRLRLGLEKMRSILEGERSP